MISIVLMGRARVKKNGQKVVRTRYGGITKINTPQYILWHNQALREAIRQRPALHKPIAEAMNVSFKFYFKNHQHEADLSNLIEGPQDLLKETGYILDDKLIYSLDGSEKIYDENEDERVAITITLRPEAKNQITKKKLPITKRAKSKINTVPVT